ncbi:MAG: patatin-like phospholipase family protein [Pseudomonadota bacterium]
MKIRNVLAIDGGGVRGIVAAVLLDALDGERRALGAQRPLSDCFDLLAGTSTGAIIAGGLVAPDKTGEGPRATPAVLRDLYRSESANIFPRRFWCRLPVIGRLRQFFGPLYRPDALIRILTNLLGDASFSDLRRNLIISSYAIDPRGAAFFRGGPDYAGKTLPQGVTPPALGVSLVDAIVGSAAAPTFFPPHQIRDRNTGDISTVIDGGVFLNDPALLALAEAVMLFPDDDIRVISVGTGRLTNPYPFNRARSWGFFEWLSPVGEFRTPLISAISDGQARAVNAQMKKLLGASHYHRFDYDLSLGYGSPNLDDASRTNMKRLEEGALKMAEKMRPQIREVAKLLDP